MENKCDKSKCHIIAKALSCLDISIFLVLVEFHSNILGQYECLSNFSIDYKITAICNSMKRLNGEIFLRCSFHFFNFQNGLVLSCECETFRLVVTFEFSSHQKLLEIVIINKFNAGDTPIFISMFVVFTCDTRVSSVFKNFSYFFPHSLHSMLRRVKLWSKLEYTYLLCVSSRSSKRHK